MERHDTTSYGGAATEHATTNPSCWRGAAEMRVANDGVSYSYDDFVQHYGVNLGARKWNVAAACTESRTFNDATEHESKLLTELMQKLCVSVCDGKTMQQVGNRSHQCRDDISPPSNLVASLMPPS